MTVVSETTQEILDGMLRGNKHLYELCLDAPNFAYWFNRLAVKAREADRPKEQS